jgi:tetratricopeptide (TPR) repeat protein
MFEGITARWLTHAIDAMPLKEIRIFAQTLPDDKDFFLNLKLYICNSHFADFRVDLFAKDGSFLNNRRLFSEFYGLVQSHVKDFSVSEAKKLTSWIEKMSISHNSVLFNKVCQIDLLNLMTTSENGISENVLQPATNLKIKILSSISDGDKEKMLDFLSPENISKNYWMGEVVDATNDDSEKKTQLLTLENEDYIHFLQNIDDNNPDTFAAIEIAPIFFEKKHTLAWLSDNCFQNFKKYPTKEYDVLISFIFSDKSDVSLAEAVEFSNQCLQNEKDETRQKTAATLMRYFYFALQEKYKESKSDFDAAYRLAKNIYDENIIDWEEANTQEFTSFESFLSFESFYLLGVLALSFQPEEKNDIEKLFESLFQDANKAWVAKATISAHISRFWRMDSAWVKEHIGLIFKNEKNNHNCSYLGFSLSLFYAPDFINLLLQNDILNPLMNSKDFDEFGCYFGNYVLRSYFDDGCSEKAASIVIQSIQGVASLHVFNDYLLKAKVLENEKNSHKFSLLLDEVLVKGIGGEKDTGRLIIQLISLHSLFHDKEKITKTICKLAPNSGNVYATEIRGAIEKSDLTNDEKIRIIQSIVGGITDGYLFTDEIIGLIKTADWSEKDIEINQVKNHLGKLNPNIYEKMKSI